MKRTAQIKIQINGQSRETFASTVQELLSELKLLPTQVAVEHNGTVLFRHELNHSSIQENDRVEIVRVVAGG